MLLDNNCIETFTYNMPLNFQETVSTKLLQWWADMCDALTYKQAKYSAGCRVQTEHNIKLVKRKQCFYVFFCSHCSHLITS